MSACLGETNRKTVKPKGTLQVLQVSKQNLNFRWVAHDLEDVRVKASMRK